MIESRWSQEARGGCSSTEHPLLMPRPSSVTVGRGGPTPTVVSSSAAGPLRPHRCYWRGCCRALGVEVRGQDGVVRPDRGGTRRVRQSVVPVGEDVAPIVVDCDGVDGTSGPLEGEGAVSARHGGTA